MSFSNFEISNAILRDMQDVAITGSSIFIVDPSLMKFIDCNDTAIETLGYSREELLEIGMQDIAPGEGCVLEVRIPFDQPLSFLNN